MAGQYRMSHDWLAQDTRPVGRRSVDLISVRACPDTVVFWLCERLSTRHGMQNTRAGSTVAGCDDIAGAQGAATTSVSE